MPTKLDFKAENKVISDVLFDKYRYQIPRYQRPYAWGEDELTEFWNDLSNTEEDSFIGSLIFNYENYQKTGLIEVIDGQQRLITITLLAAVMRDIAESLDPEMAKLFIEVI
ncbi:DUF262 domain-containing protein [Chloroflexota bacterium]